MGNFVLRMLSVVAGVVVLLSLSGTAVASADPLKGMTYSDAAAAVEKYHGTAVVATVSGDQLDLDSCIVVSWNTSIFLDASGRNGRKREYRMNLNCNHPVASPGQPGNSAVSPEGAKAKKEIAASETINTNPAWCKQDEKHMRWCGDICKHTGLCEI